MRIASGITGWRKKKPVIFFGSLALAILLLLGSTLAWFTASDLILNAIRREEPSKNFQVMEVDDFPPGQDTTDSIVKRVGAQNVGDVPAFVRLLVLPVFRSAEGHLLPAVLGKAGDPGVNIVVEDFNLASFIAGAWTEGDWADGGDGYYYYLHRLDPATTTNSGSPDKNLFNSLKLVSVPEGYEDAKLLIEVKCEAVEVKNYREAWWGLTNNAAPTSPPVESTLLATVISIDDRLRGQMG